MKPFSGAYDAGIRRVAVIPKDRAPLRDGAEVDSADRAEARGTTYTARDLVDLADEREESVYVYEVPATGSRWLEVEPATLTGREAIEAHRASPESTRLDKYTDPTEGAREGLTIAEAEAIAAEDPALIYLVRL